MWRRKRHCCSCHAASSSQPCIHAANGQLPAMHPRGQWPATILLPQRKETLPHKLLLTVSAESEFHSHPLTFTSVEGTAQSLSNSWGCGREATPENHYFKQQKINMKWTFICSTSVRIRFREYVEQRTDLYSATVQFLECQFQSY